MQTKVSNKNNTPELFITSNQMWHFSVLIKTLWTFVDILATIECHESLTGATSPEGTLNCNMEYQLGTSDFQWFCSEILDFIFKLNQELKLVKLSLIIFEGDAWGGCLFVCEWWQIKIFLWLWRTYCWR